MAFTRYKKGRKFYLIRLLLKPMSKFIEVYFIKRGLLDGLPGFIIAVSSAYSTFATEAKHYELDCLGVERLSNLSPTYKKQN